MNKKKVFLLVSILSLLCIPKVKAECYEDEFKQLENQYRIETQYDLSSKTYSMDIYTSKNKRYAYTTTISSLYSCDIISETHTHCTGLAPGQSFIANIVDYQLEKECKSETIYLKKVNYYYQDPLCNGIEEFVLCQETYDGEIDRETFDKRVEIYREEKSKEEQKPEELAKEEKSIKSILKKISNYFQIYYQYILISIMLLVAIIVITVLSIRRYIKRRRLE